MIALLKKAVVGLIVAPVFVFATQGVQVESAISGYSLTTGAYAASGTVEFLTMTGVSLTKMSIQMLV